VNEGAATPGIFFKFDIEPIAIRIQEKTTSFIEFIIRVVGVFGGVWCCFGWAVRVSYKAVEVVTGVKEGEQEIVAVEATGAKKRGWGGGDLKRRVVKQGNGWVIDGANSEWAGVGTPHSASFNFSGPGSVPGQGYYSPTPHTPLPHTPLPHTPLPGSAHYGYSSPRPPMAHGLPPPTPHGHMGGFPASPFPGNESPFAAGQAAGIGGMGGMNHLGVPGTPPAPGPPPQGPPRRKDSMASLNGDQTKKDR
jgi:endoplasmic reticulum-Golgi intermediate compartment protein 2